MLCVDLDGALNRDAPSDPARLGVHACAATVDVMPRGSLYITGKRSADDLLNSNGTALIIGMLLDQQVPMEWAFHGPFTLKERLGHLDPRRIAGHDIDEFVSLCCEKPAIHRFPAAMGRRIHELCCTIAQQYGGRTDNIWLKAVDGADLYARLIQLPGFGDEKAKIFIALLGKRRGVQLQGWQKAAGKFGDDVKRSVADIDSAESLAVVRDWKRAQKVAKLDKQDRPVV